MAPSPSTLIYGVTVPAVFLAIASARPRRSVRIRCLSQSQLLLSSTSSAPPRKTSAVMDSLRVLEWEKLCDCVASFAGTQLGREATKEKLLSLDMRYDESMRLLEETTAAVEMAKWGVGGMDFSGVNALMVKSAIERAMRGFPLTGMEAIATASLILLAETLQLNLKASIKEDIDRQNQFLPLAEVIMEMTVNRSFVDMVYRLIDDDGSVKDSASSDVRRFREQVRLLEKKLYHLMDKLARTDKNGASSSEVNIVNGRWCLKLISSETANYEGLLLSSGTGFGSLVEPLAAIPLNDELQQARSLVSRAEEDVLSKLTDKMLAEVQDIGQLLDTVIRLDVIFARAKYGMAYGGTFPDLLLSNDEDQAYISRDTSSDFFMGENRWKLYMRKAYHPLLLHQHKENLQRAKKDVTSTITEIRRRKSYDGYITSNDDMESKLASLKQKVAELEEERPVPVDFLVSAKTNVVVVTGPNTGGKTISLKTIGLASLMAKSGLYVLADEPVRIPWFDSIFADIGDEQSLSQSLSTFSGHLKQINAIQSNSTKQSLVLLDEVGAGTNPLEGAALGMSILESFAERGSLLTVATTHHGELKTLKYSNNCFENACMEFDEVNLKPTYKILWGVPGRSNAINIAERLGLPKDILDIARDAYGTASAEINEIITDMERYKQDIQKLLQEAQLNLMLAKKLHENLLATRSRINQHSLKLKARKTQAIFDSAALTRSSLRNILRQVRELRTTQAAEKGRGQDSSSAVERDDSSTSLPPAENGSSTPTPGASLGSTGTIIKGSSTGEVPKIGDMVYVASLGKNVIVLKVDAPKGEVIVQASKMKLRIKLSEIQVRR